MKRWLLWIALVIVAAAWAIAVRSALKASAQKERAAHYQSALQSYSQSLKPGLPRQEVEDYFRANGIQFQPGAAADLVKVGQEDATRDCREIDVFVAFEFDGARVLQNIKIFRQPESCR